MPQSQSFRVLLLLIGDWLAADDGLRVLNKDRDSGPLAYAHQTSARATHHTPHDKGCGLSKPSARVSHLFCRLETWLTRSGDVTVGVVVRDPHPGPVAILRRGPSGPRRRLASLPAAGQFARQPLFFCLCDLKARHHDVL